MDSAQGCVSSHTVVTNPNGYYTDTLTCTDNISRVIIIVDNCNGAKITHDLTIGPNTMVESNFVICTAISTPPPVSCKAAFSYSALASGIKFNSVGSATVSGDSIISRTWIFGDSSASLTGNIVDPSHAYTKAGTYNVCLYIKTKAGCESSYCQTVTFTPPVPTNCKAQFTASVQGKTVTFNSANSSSAGTTDSIISRTWIFGDSSSYLTGNRVDPSHQYAKAGTYTACLYIKTKSGCENKYCLDFTIRDSVVQIPTNCKAVFTYTIKDSTVIFNSADSKGTSADDSIISRVWYFSDGTTNASLSGNEIAPSHKYLKPGTYNVYLIIKTKNGCESRYTNTVIIAAHIPPPTNCKAYFYYTIKDSVISFNSEGSSAGSLTDSIISRTWYYADSSTSVSLTGNVINPYYTYTKPGSYNVYLVIRTKNGCESKYTRTVVIPKPIPPTGCKAYFNYTIKDSIITFNSEGSVASSSTDSIISRTWYYADSSTSVSLTGNVINPYYTYTKPGSYNVYLVIKTKNGCESSYSRTVIIPKPIPPTSCKAYFNYTIKDSIITFNSEGSVASSSADSIISRTWYYADNTTSVSLTGNVIKPYYTYSKPGSYNVYLVIKTKNGCESKFNAIVVIAPPPPPTGCKAVFTYAMQYGVVKFNSSASIGTTDKDSIISRYWIFGDSSNTSTLQGSIDPSHNYTKAGKYTVILYIKTKNGCESKYSETISIVLAPPVNCNIEVQFTAERISLKKVQFNSSLSKAQLGDSIIQRNWKFGDNTLLSGNEVSPVKEFAFTGIYNVCLEEKTAKGCVAQTCKQVTVQDTITTPQSSVDYVKIISINPNPVITNMTTTIFSRNSNVEAEICVYDIYGVRKITIKKLLSQGNNIIEIQTSNLYHGPYFLRVISKSGADSKIFYKL